MMKRMAVVLCTLLVAPASAKAAFLIEGYGTALRTGVSIPTQIGGGGTVGFSFYDDLSFAYRGMYAVASRKPRYGERKTCNHMMHLAGLEYGLDIQAVPVAWRIAIMSGYSRTRIDVLDYETNFLESVAVSKITSYVSPEFANLLTYHFLFHVRARRDAGIALAAWTGLELRLFPPVVPFFEIGVHRSWYDRSLGGRKILGYHCVFGVRCNVEGPS